MSGMPIMPIFHTPHDRIRALVADGERLIERMAFWSAILPGVIRSAWLSGQAARLETITASIMAAVHKAPRQP
jgi:hypothetical protein